MNFKPNFFIPGAEKYGITSLYNHFQEIDEGCMCDSKEPFCFEYEYHQNNEKIIGEARIFNS